jgi:hypothetical protein
MAIFGPPPVSYAIRIGRRTFARKLFHLGFEHQFDKRLPDGSEQIAQAGLCQLRYIGQRKRQLNGRRVGQRPLSELLSSTPATDLVLSFHERLLFLGRKFPRAYHGSG